MTDLLLYEIRMHLSGRLTQLPDSQKIFGALVYLYAQNTTSEDASAFVAKIKDEHIFCTVSNMLPLGYLPTPQPYLLDKYTSTITESKKTFYKAAKRREYIKHEELEGVMKTPEQIIGTCHYICTRQSQQIHASIDSMQFDCPGLDPNLYSLPEITMVEVTNEEKKEEKPVSDFFFYLAIEDCETGTELIAALKNAQNTTRPFFLGPRASQGLNIFTIQDIVCDKLSKPPDTPYYLNLGMLLPKSIDFQRSFLTLFTSERRPYQQVEGWDTHMKNQFISFIRAGSLLYISGGLPSAGLSICSPYDDQAIVFGNAFLYPIPSNWLSKEGEANQ